jgi:hypothetical protein
MHEHERIDSEPQGECAADYPQPADRVTLPVVERVGPHGVHRSPGVPHPPGAAPRQRRLNAGPKDSNFGREDFAQSLGEPPFRSKYPDSSLGRC